MNDVNVKRKEFEEFDNYRKIVVDLNFLTDKCLILKAKMKMTPWYRLGTQLKFLKELDELGKEIEDIHERLDKLEKNPIQIVKRP